MLAARLHEYDETFSRSEILRLEEVPEPQVEEPDDVIVRIGGAGLCRSDLHIIDGSLRSQLNTPLPIILGHENAGWVHAVGDMVRTVKPGDPVIVHLVITDGVCPACRRGEDMHCAGLKFPGIDTDGGFAQFLRVKERSVLKLPAGLDPKEAAPYADAGLTSYRAARKAAAILRPGMSAVIIGFGGLGHVGAQILRVLCAARITIVDVSTAALELASQLGFTELVHGGPGAVEEVRRLTGGGADAVLDFVGEKGTPEQAIGMLRSGGTYFVIGLGGILQVPTAALVAGEYSIVGSLAGNFSDLREVIALAAEGRVRIALRFYPLSEINQAIHDLAAGRIAGRAVLVP